MDFTDKELKIIKTNIISIGTCCFFGLYKYKFFRNLYINKYGYKKYPLKKKNLDTGTTHFFDWLLCTYPNNIKILTTTEPDKIFNHKNWSVRKGVATLNLNIDFKNSYLIKSLHDLNNSGYTLQNNVIDKYIRRHKRLIKFLKNNNNLILCYSDNLSDTEAKHISDTIKNLTTKNFIILIWDYFKDDYKNKYTHNNNIYRINFNLLSLSPKNSDQLYNKHYSNINTDLFFKTIITIYNDSFCV